VCSSIDGIKLDTGDIKLYTLSGGSGNDVIPKIIDVYTNKVGQGLIDYDGFLGMTILNPKYYKNTNTFEKITDVLVDDPEIRFYMVMSDIMLDDNKYKTFVDSLITDKIKNDTSGTMEQSIRTYCEEFKVKCKIEHDAEMKNFDTVENTPVYVSYKEFKITEFDTKVPYTTENLSNTNQNKKRIKDLYSDLNVNISNKTYNGKVKFN
jgi:hypothetical protein